MVRRAAELPQLSSVGLHVHIGSQLSSVGPIVEATRRVLELWDVLAVEGIRLRGLISVAGWALRIAPTTTRRGRDALAAGLRPLLAGREVELLVEPGRFLVGPAGVLLTTVTYREGGGRRAGFGGS